MALSNPLETLGFGSLFDASAEALILADSQGLMRASNQEAQQLFGYAARELLGEPVEMLIPLRLREHHKRYMQHYAHHPEKRPMGRGRDLLALARDGRELQVDIGLSPLVHAGETFILISFFDASQSRHAQRLLQASEERLRLAEDAAGLGVFDRDLESNALHWDARSLAIIGLPEGSAITYDHFLGLIHPDDRMTREAALDKALNPASGGEYRADFRIVRPSDGETRWIASTGRVMFEQGVPVRIVGIIQDVTEQKQSEAWLRDQRGALESLLKRQVAAQTASAIAHELNQPLAALSAYSEVALHELESLQVPDRLKRTLSGCVEQAHRAGSKLHELMEFLHQGDFVPEPMDLNETVREATAIVQDDGPERYRAMLELQPDLPCVKANRVQIQKVLLNLIRNGCEAMHEHGIFEGAMVLRTQALPERGLVLVTVQDAGPGLDAEQAKRVFDPFFTTKSHGIGMGLAISRALVEANGGELWADATHGTGGIFHFTLPIAP